MSVDNFGFRDELKFKRRSQDVYFNDYDAAKSRTNESKEKPSTCERT